MSEQGNNPDYLTVADMAREMHAAHFGSIGYVGFIDSIVSENPRFLGEFSLKSGNVYGKKSGPDHGVTSTVPALNTSPTKGVEPMPPRNVRQSPCAIKIIERERGRRLARRVRFARADALADVATAEGTLPLAVVSCVYFLLRGETVVYVGQTNNLLVRLGQHLLTGKGVTSCRFIRCEKDDLYELERHYIAVFRPQYNVYRTPRDRAPRRKYAPIPTDRDLELA